MPEDFQGLTIPSYADTSDGPAAFAAFVESGPIPRFANAAARDAAITDPVSGQFCWMLDTSRLLQYTTPTTGWQPPWNTAWGLLTTRSTSGLGEQWFSSATYTAYTGLLATLTVPANRVIRMKASGLAREVTGTNPHVRVLATVTAGTLVVNPLVVIDTISTFENWEVEAVATTPSTGAPQAITFGFSAANVGNGTWKNANASRLAYASYYDEGPAHFPA